VRLPTRVEVVAGLVLLAAVVVLAWNFDPFSRLKRAKAGKAVAEAQAKSIGEAVKQADAFQTKTVIIRERARRAEDAVQALPSAQTPLDPVRRAALCDGLSSVWDGAQICEPDGSSTVP
jgi:hypothetical protein